MKDFTSKKNEININVFHDDCLLHIFEYLPIEDRLTIELVCKRWKYLAKHSWSKVKSFRICKELFSKMERRTKFYTSFEEKFNHTFSVIKRSGAYLNNLPVKNNDLKIKPNDYSALLKKISKNCVNLTNFSLRGSGIFKDKKEMKYLKNIFEKNTKISSISITFQCLNGNILSNFQADLITELTLVNCYYHPEKYFLNFVRKIKKCD